MARKLLVGFLALVAVVCAQRRVDPRNTYQRIICVVPMVGSGMTPEDPRRPMYAPWPPTPNAARTGIIGFAHQVSDDGRYAIVEFVALDRAAFEEILKDKSVKVFEKGKAKKDDLARELRRYKRTFDLDRFGVVMP